MSNSATLTVTLEPAARRHHHPAGSRHALQRRQRHQLSPGTASDPEDGTLPASAFTWRVDFHHDTSLASAHPADDGRDERLVHRCRRPGIPRPTSGTASSSPFAIPPARRRRRSGTCCRARCNLTLATNPAGLQLRLDAQPTATPLTFESVVGIVRGLDAPATQTSGGTTYEFVSWSDGGAANHNDLDAGGQHDLHRDVPRRRPAAPATGCPRPTTTTSISPARPWRASIRRSTSRGARGRPRRPSAPTRSASAGQARSSRSSPAPTRSTR